MSLSIRKPHSFVATENLILVGRRRENVGTKLAHRPESGLLTIRARRSVDLPSWCRKAYSSD